ncbi:hypothetical protein EYF80_052634 [Liparis tanakae]|uniref:Uncharacterized protein n=1 Tax=Liparis tanakae TaxID=230148 RepID=A0A4Z2F7R7_9TELE|nr:hypothetical protein EYF80_052634 [Liparis tanakae]
MADEMPAVAQAVDEATARKCKLVVSARRFLEVLVLVLAGPLLPSRHLHLAPAGHRCGAQCSRR